MKYRLLKELPWCNAGNIFELKGGAWLTYFGVNK
nr:MAG TPA: hypothetical protein [Caudoviricetes sp.]